MIDLLLPTYGFDSLRPGACETRDRAHRDQKKCHQAGRQVDPAQITMVVVWNPVKQINEAWNGAASKWGKGAIVLFFSFVWLLIGFSVWQVFVPLSQGNICIVAGIDDEWAIAWITGMLNALAYILLAFLLYAAWHGAKMWNVAFVTLVMVGWSFTWFFWRLPQLRSIKHANKECMTFFSWQMGVFIAWPVLALLCAIMEHRATPRGTSGETQQLVV